MNVVMNGIVPGICGKVQEDSIYVNYNDSHSDETHVTFGTWPGIKF